MKVKFLLLLVVVLLASSCASKRNTGSRAPSKGFPAGETAKTNGTKRPGATSVTGLAYIERYKAIAIAEMNKYGIPASIKLAQALLESGNGNSYLAQNANNHFGIKCGGVWNGKSMNRPDDTANDCFRVYDQAEQSFKDHSQFLLRKRYEKLFTLNKNDYKGWAQGLKAAGYATNPRYPQLLIDLIERYELTQYDRAESSPVAKEIREEKVEELIVEKAKVEPVAVAAQEVKSPVAMVIYEVKSSDTLFAISQKYQISVEKIKSLNGLDTDEVAVGQLLVISK